MRRYLPVIPEYTIDVNYWSPSAELKCQADDLQPHSMGDLGIDAS